MNLSEIPNSSTGEVLSPVEGVAESGNAPGNSGVVGNNNANALQNGNNELNLQKENESDNESNQNDIPLGGQVPQSIPQGEYGTQAPQISGMEETASRLRERIEADGGTSQGGLSRNVRDVENRVTREYAQENGLWIPFEDVFKLGRPSKSGNEHDTYLNAEQGVIYKVNNRMNTPSIPDLLDRMEQHNEFFPDSKYSLVGFTAVSENGDVWPVFAQEYVPNARMATNEEIDSYMGALGFNRVGDGRYSNGEVVIKDLKPRNVLADADGDIYVVDADFEQEVSVKSDEIAQNSGENITESAENVETEQENVETIGDEQTQTAETEDQPDLLTSQGIVNTETLLSTMSESDFAELVKGDDIEAMRAYIKEIDDALRMDEASPLAGEMALREEYRRAVEQYGGKENIPAEVMQSLNERMKPYSELSRALFDCKYALQDRVRELESAAEKVMLYNEVENSEDILNDIEKELSLEQTNIQKDEKSILPERIVDRILRGYSRRGRGEQPTGEIADIARRYNEGRTIIADTPLLRDFLKLIKRLTYYEIDNYLLSQYKEDTVTSC